MIYSFDYEGECWWCGAVSDSAEHRHKRTDLVREFGRGPYQGQQAPVRVRAGAPRGFRSPTSEQVKFEKSLCARCNNERSQPFDRAYDSFASFVRAEEPVILRERRFRLSDVYGANWRTQREDLLRFYVKHIGCRLAEADIVVIQQLRDFLDGRTALACLTLEVEIRSDIATLTKVFSRRDGDMPSLWQGDLNAQLNRCTGEIDQVASFVGYRWLRVSWLYDEGIIQPQHPFSVDRVDLPAAHNVHPLRVRMGLAKRSVLDRFGLLRDDDFT